MGVDIYAAIGRWDRVVEIVESVGADELWMVIWADGPDDDVCYADGRFLWPPGDSPWYGECVFRGLGASGSFKAHWWLGELWEHARVRSDIAADLVALFDVFIGRLIWLGNDGEADLVGPSGLSADQGLHTACSPAEVAVLARHWSLCAARLEGLRGPLTAELAESTNRYDFFDQWATVLADWGEIVQEADRRGWGLFYFIQ